MGIQLVVSAKSSLSGPENALLRPRSACSSVIVSEIASDISIKPRAEQGCTQQGLGEEGGSSSRLRLPWGGAAETRPGRAGACLPPLLASDITLARDTDCRQAWLTHCAERWFSGCLDQNVLQSGTSWGREAITGVSGSMVRVPQGPELKPEAVSCWHWETAYDGRWPSSQPQGPLPGSFPGARGLEADIAARVHGGAAGRRPCPRACGSPFV